MNTLLLRRIGWCALALALWCGRLVAGPELERRAWLVDSVEREALVRLPASLPKEGAPVVFVFHGHGGTMRHATRAFGIHELWPEAIVVYPQGLPTASRRVDPEGKKSGWQQEPGDQGDRDVKFFDAMLASLAKETRVDARRVYVTGHSNGGLFTYELWAMRGDRIAAVAPSAALLVKGARELKPKPALIVASPGDTVVNYAWQERMIDRVLRLNRCEAPAKPWSGVLSPAGKGGNDVELFIHDGGHEYPKDASARIVAFFKAHPAAASAR